MQKPRKNDSFVALRAFRPCAVAGERKASNNVVLKAEKPSPDTPKTSPKTKNAKETATTPKKCSGSAQEAAKSPPMSPTSPTQRPKNDKRCEKTCPNRQSLLLTKNHVSFPRCHLKLFMSGPRMTKTAPKALKGTPRVIQEDPTSPQAWPECNPRSLQDHLPQEQPNSLQE